MAFAKLYDCKTPITAADILNNRVLLFLKSMRLSYRECYGKTPMRRFLDSIPLAKAIGRPFETAGIQQMGKVSLATRLTRWCSSAGVAR